MMDQWILALTGPLRNTRSTTIFCKAVYGFVLLKILLSWGTLVELAEVYTLNNPRSVPVLMVFGLGEWAGHHMTAFLLVYVAILLLALCLRPNYFTAIIIAWLWLNLYRLSFPVSNGADMVATGLLFLAIPLSAYPVIAQPAGEMVQRCVYHTTHLLARIYVCSIYLVSGVDKLRSEAWWSGEAMGRVRQLTYAFNPLFDTWFPSHGAGSVVLAWITIGFELMFVVLVWFKITRKWVLITGVMFHIIIGAMLTLPEFAVVMIVSYTIFFKLEDNRSKK